MKYVSSKVFLSQVQELTKKYRKLPKDLEDFFGDFHLDVGIDLGSGFYKFRIKNSSIPTGKSGGFRIIIKMIGNHLLPVALYSKTFRENISSEEILQLYEKIIKEI